MESLVSLSVRILFHRMEQLNVCCCRTHPQANITLSGKKRRRLLKQLKHMQADKNAMDSECFFCAECDEVGTAFQSSSSLIFSAFFSRGNEYTFHSQIQQEKEWERGGAEDRDKWCGDGGSCRVTRRFWRWTEIFNTSWAKTYCQFFHNTKKYVHFSSTE